MQHIALNLIFDYFQCITNICLFLFGLLQLTISLQIILGLLFSYAFQIVKLFVDYTRITFFICLSKCEIICRLYSDYFFICLTKCVIICRLYSDYFFLKRGVPTSAAFDVAVNSSLQILNECNRVKSLRRCLYDANHIHKWVEKVLLGIFIDLSHV